MILNYSSIAAASCQINTFDLFALGSDQRIYHKRRNKQSLFVPPNPQWDTLDNNLFQSPPSAVALNENRIDVFALGTDNQIYRYTWNGGNWASQWNALGGNFISQPYAVALGQTSCIVFALTANHEISAMMWDGSNQGSWETLGGNFASPAVAISVDGQRLDVFALKANNQMYHTTWSKAGWQPDWEELGGDFACPPCVVARNIKNGSFDLFALGSDWQIYNKTWNGEQWWPVVSTDWSTMGALLDSCPSGAVLGQDHFALTVLEPMKNASPQIGCKVQYGSFWLPSLDGWENTGAISSPVEFASPPCALGRGQIRLDIFVLGSDRQMYYQSWDGIRWYPTQDDWQALGGNFPEQPIMGLRLPSSVGGH